MKPTKVITTSISNIRFGDRARIDYDDIDALAETIQKHGVIHPIAVQQIDPDKEEYLLVAGGRRLTACLKLGLKTLTVNVYPPDLTDLNKKQIEAIENFSRLDLTWQERVNLENLVYQLEVEEKGEKVSRTPDGEGVTKKSVAENILKKSASHLADNIRFKETIDKLPENLKQAVLNCKTQKDAKNLVRKIFKQTSLSISAREAEERPIEKVHKLLISSYNVGDFFEGVSDFPDGQADFGYNLLEIDPPYGIDLDKNKKMGDGDSQKIGMMDYVEVPRDEYREFIKKVAVESYRVLANDSWLILWYDVKKPWIADILEEVGFNVRRIPGLWIKPSGQTRAPHLHLANCYETFFYASKGNPSISNRGRSNIFNFSPVIAKEKIHQTERPVELIQEVLTTFIDPSSSKARIMVPFLGSGNTILAAANMNMAGVGWDLSENFKNAYTDRVLNGEIPYKSYS